MLNARPDNPEHEAETFAAQEAIAATLQHYIAAHAPETAD